MTGYLYSVWCARPQCGVISYKSVHTSYNQLILVVCGAACNLWCRVQKLNIKGGAAEATVSQRWSGSVTTACGILKVVFPRELLTGLLFSRRNYVNPQPYLELLLLLCWHPTKTIGLPRSWLNHPTKYLPYQLIPLVVHIVLLFLGVTVDHGTVDFLVPPSTCIAKKTTGTTKTFTCIQKITSYMYQHEVMDSPTADDVRRDTVKRRLDFEGAFSQVAETGDASGQDTCGRDFAAHSDAEKVLRFLEPEIRFKFESVCREFRENYRSSTRKYIADVFLPRNDEFGDQAIRYLAERTSQRTSGFFGFSAEKDHIHVIHDCSYSGRSCRCRFREVLGCLGTLKRNERFLRNCSDIQESDWTRILFYYFLQNGELKAYQIKGFPSDFLLTLNLYTTENLYENGQKNFAKNKLFGASMMPLQNNTEISAALETLIILLKKDFMTRNPTVKDSTEKSPNVNQYGTSYANKFSNYSNNFTQHRSRPYVPWKFLKNRQY